MISCVFALIFLTAPNQIYDQSSLESPNQWKQMPHLNRLVLLSDSYKGSFYSAYKIGDSGGFPEIKVEDDIFTTADQSTHKPTKLRAYCSPTLSSTEIIKFFYPKLEGHELSSEKCRKVIYKQWDGSKDKTKSGNQIISQSSTCSNSDIIGLAFQGDISIVGGYNRYAPSKNQNVPLVAFSNTLDLEDLVSDRQLYAAWEKDESQMVLVWYYGQLHLFKRSREDKSWWPMTDLNNPAKNGAMILNFLRNRLRLFQELDKILGRYSYRQDFSTYLRKVSGRRPPNKIEKVYRLMAEISYSALQEPATAPSSYLKFDMGLHSESKKIKKASLR
ncbi:BgTH12-07658 [Blumeria graminis f. sp. triticale]|uniref:BgTH12-07658 n=1 Tax=Blumeria graminis f. sp. triticale TaxID=1689686 RepID=A0A9W4GCG6_BLUGR|nr:BgTH12-07658 [Blumeria graminis f. sp. triticale]